MELVGVLASLLLIQGCSAGLENFQDDLLDCPNDFFAQCRSKVDLPDDSVLGFECLPFFEAFDIDQGQRKCYRTCPFQNQFNDPDCARCLAEREGLNMTRGEFFIVYRLRSPGSEDYQDNSICDYRVECDSGQSLFYTIVNHELEPRDLTGQCLDALSISNSDFNPFGEPTCGVVDPSDEEASGYGLGDLFVNFASNGARQSTGFFLFALCVNDEFQEKDGCTITGSGSGKKRSVDRHDEALNRDKRSFRVPCIKVKAGQVVRYKDYTLTVESIKDGQVLYRFWNILVLQIYNQLEGFLTFRRSAKLDTYKYRVFPGFGELQVGKGIAHYIQTDINPRFLLSAEEIALINSLVGTLATNGFFDDERFVLGPSGLAGPPGMVDPPQCDELIRSGLMEIAENETENCRGFVSAAAEFFLMIAEQCRP